MLGYKIERSYGNTYDHLTLRFFEITDYISTSFAQISWQIDSDSDHWYGFDIKNSGHYESHLQLFIKFAQKVMKAEKYGETPENFLNWLVDLRGMKRLVTDRRIDKLVEIETYFDTDACKGFQIYVNGEYTHLILATSENDAKARMYKKYTEGYSATTKIEQFAKNGHVVEREFIRWEMPPTIENLLKI